MTFGLLKRGTSANARNHSENMKNLMVLMENFMFGTSIHVFKIQAHEVVCAVISGQMRHGIRIGQRECALSGIDFAANGRHKTKYCNS